MVLYFKQTYIIMKTVNYLLAIFLCFSVLCFSSCEENKPELPDETTGPGDDGTDPGDGTNPGDDETNTSMLVTSMYNGNYYKFEYDYQNRLVGVSKSEQMEGVYTDLYTVSYPEQKILSYSDGNVYEYVFETNDKGYITRISIDGYDYDDYVREFEYDGDYLIRYKTRSLLSDGTLYEGQYELSWENGNLVKDKYIQIYKDQQGNEIEYLCYEKETVYSYDDSEINSGIYPYEYESFLRLPFEYLCYGGVFGKTTAKLPVEYNGKVKYDEKGRIVIANWGAFAYDGNPLEDKVNPAVQTDSLKLVSSMIGNVKYGLPWNGTFYMSYDSKNRLEKVRVKRLSNSGINIGYFPFLGISGLISSSESNDNGYITYFRAYSGYSCICEYDGDYLVGKTIKNDETGEIVEKYSYFWESGDLMRIVKTVGDKSTTMYFTYDENSPINSGIYLPQMCLSDGVCRIADSFSYPLYYGGLLGKTTTRIPSSVVYSDKASPSDIKVLCDEKGRIIRCWEDDELLYVYAYDGNEAVWPEN